MLGAVGKGVEAGAGAAKRFQNSRYPKPQVVAPIVTGGFNMTAAQVQCI